MSASEHGGEVILRIAPTLPRRLIASGMTGAVGLISLAIALDRPPDNPLWTGFLLAVGLAALWGALRLWRATGQGIVVTAGALATDDGEVIAPLDAIEKVDRGFLALKPSGGFALRLRAPMPARWVPGLWWRFGRRVGVGGTLPPAAARMLADALTARCLGAGRPPGGEGGSGA